MRLSEKVLSGLKCPDGKKDALFFDETHRGLGVRVTANDRKSFVAQYRFNGQKRRIPLGAYSETFKIKDAQKAAARVIGDVSRGIDPAAVRKADAIEGKRTKAHDALTLDVLLEQWQALRLADKRPRYAAEAVRALRFAFKDQRSLPAAKLDRQTVVGVLDGLTRSGAKAMANRTAAYGRAAYAWAMKRGSLTSNPFTTLPLTRVPSRERVVTDTELSAIWRATEGASSFNSIVRLLILTGQRRDEVTGMTWGELSPDLSTWIIPAARAKNGAAHVVPLSSHAQAILPKTEKRDNGANVERQDADLVFPGLRGPFNGFGKAKAQLDTASGVDNWRVHDLRRTMATGLQKLGVRLEVTEAVLNHVAGSRSGIVGVYQRHDYADEKRAALAAWGARVAAIVEGREAANNVVSLRA